MDAVMNTQEKLAAARERLGRLLAAEPEDMDPVAIKAAKKEAEALAAQLKQQLLEIAGSPVEEEEAAQVVVTVPPPAPPRKAPITGRRGSIAKPTKPEPAPLPEKHEVSPDEQLRIGRAINVVQRLGIPKLTVEQRGTWIWLHGETREFSKQLYELGFRWDKPKTKARSDGLGVWYMPPPGSRRKRGSGMTEDEIVERHGSKRIV